MRRRLLIGFVAPLVIGTERSNPGVYVVSAVVPPGGVGSIKVGHGESTSPVANPHHG
jgi:hypothetical protein